ncbi:MULTISPECIES: DinI-like family protein [Edwardsiella]|uniref:Penicillin-binding protein n=2 Tax=Edwardsiella anguillarum TaxID=1821960 RepID=A0A076LLD8_9GAMM|nr:MULTISPECIES: DinI-like family protein [Edwardsiella]AKM48525.1 penicillin-binding protein [Edwardsiella sp. EA181011]GAJ67780.1 hypothetical protein MA13_contig00007-0088 [Edwardsiella piscicida]AIJ09295.1 Hypothetical protein ETEE_2863 [Edwardsiella anguillarum ET080813]AKR77143.1 DinI-like family protein [Edwardsiella sp. LADL05-105]KAB0589427.1 DinI family protein [Edwardsiella anguillarum]
MDIKISIADTSIAHLSATEYDAYVAELGARVKEVYPESSLLIVHDGDETTFTAEGFHDNEEVRIVLHELQQDVQQHGHWRS